MGAAILASPTAAQRNRHSLDPTRTSRKAAKSSRSFAMRLQRVDGRRFDALVADILCSRLHGVAARTVSYVSAPLVRLASVHLCECASLCVCSPRQSVEVCSFVFCRYPIAAIFDSIDVELMEKSFVIFNQYWPRCCAPAVNDLPPLHNKRGRPASNSHHPCTIKECALRSIISWTSSPRRSRYAPWRA
jgi:hypothetical protein